VKCWTNEWDFIKFIFYCNFLIHIFHYRFYTAHNIRNLNLRQKKIFLARPQIELIKQYFLTDRSLIASFVNYVRTYNHEPSFVNVTTIIKREYCLHVAWMANNSRISMLSFPHSFVTASFCISDASRIRRQ